MIENTVMLNTPSDIKGFVALMERVEGDVLVYSDKYVINGKSIVGLLSLDLTLPIKVKFEIDGKIPEDVKTGMIKYLYNN